MGRYRALQTVRDKMQIAAFKSIFRSNPDLVPEMRLVHAILATCDDALAAHGKESLIEQWTKQYEKNSTCSLLDDMNPDHPAEFPDVEIKQYRV